MILILLLLILFAMMFGGLALFVAKLFVVGLFVAAGARADRRLRLVAAHAYNVTRWGLLLPAPLLARRGASRRSQGEARAGAACAL
jgi:hypothetical protein